MGVVLELCSKKEDKCVCVLCGVVVFLVIDCGEVWLFVW